MGFLDFARHFPGPKTAGDPHGVKLRQAIREADEGECPLCLVLLDHERARLYWLAYEGLADAALRRRIAAARGFCPRHLRAVYDVISDQTRNLSAIAQVMRDLVALDRAAIAAANAASGRPKSAAARLLSALRASARCPLCEEAAEVEARKVSAFVAAISDEDTCHAYEGGRGGLCRRHVVAALATSPDATALRTIVDTYASGLERDDADLAELLRKTDHRFAHEPKGEEQRAPARSVRRFAGTCPPPASSPASLKLDPAADGGSVSCRPTHARARAARATTGGTSVAIGLMDIQGQLHEVRSAIEEAALDVLRSGKFILGPNVKAFEDEAAAYLGTGGAVGVANGTDGLTIALRACGVGEGDEVVTTPFTFYATAEAIAQAGAKPVFVDIEMGTLNIDPARIAVAVTPKTKAIVPVDLFGLPADADAIAAVAKAHGLAVVEDACQAFGATYFGRHAGGLGDLAVFSFFPTKNLGGCGDGGLVTGHDADLVDAARMLRFHGSRDKKTFERLGYNSRLDELQAAVLRVELNKLDDWNGRREQVAEWYDLYLPDEVQRPVVPDGHSHVYHLYVIRSPKRDEIATALRAREIGCASYYTTPLHLQPALSYLGHKPGDFPVTEAAADQNLALPMHPNLHEKQVREVAAAVGEALAG